MKRTIAALKALAERPGTPAEGEVARAMLKRHMKNRSDSRPRAQGIPVTWLRTGGHYIDLWASLDRLWQECPPPESWETKKKRRRHA